MTTTDTGGEVAARAEHIYRALLEMEISPDFVMRLAAKRGWEHGHAERVDREYRRFLLLAWASPRMVVPSKDVDEAWHEHIIHTRHYQLTLCGEILGKVIHHDPGLLDGSDEKRHAEAYAYTLDIYRRIFRGKAPSDIWPSCSCAGDEAMTASPRIVGIAAAAGALFMLLPSVYASLATAGLVGAAMFIPGRSREAGRTSNRRPGSRQGTEGSSGNRRETGGADGMGFVAAATIDDGAHAGTTHNSGHGDAHHAHSDAGHTGGSHSCGGHSCGGHSCGSSCGGGCGGGGGD